MSPEEPIAGTEKDAEGGKVDGAVVGSRKSSGNDS
jgi:hypothetical protein